MAVGNCTFLWRFVFHLRLQQKEFSGIAKALENAKEEEVQLAGDK